MSDEQIGQHLEHVVGSDLASHHDRQALPRVLVQHCQQLQRTPVVRPRGHEVVRPDVAPIQRPQPDARSVVEPQPTSLRLPLRDLQPLLPPDPLHPLVVHPPALDAELRLHPRPPVRLAAQLVNLPHPLTQSPVGDCSRRRPSTAPRIVPAGGDTQHSAHQPHREARLVGSHELERRSGTAPVSCANQCPAVASCASPHGAVVEHDLRAAGPGALPPGGLAGLARRALDRGRGGRVDPRGCPALS